MRRNAELYVCITVVLPGFESVQLVSEARGHCEHFSWPELMHPMLALHGQAAIVFTSSKA